MIDSAPVMHDPTTLEAPQALASAPAFFRRAMAAILLVAVILRVGLLFYAERHPQRFDFPDSHRYVRVARNIAAGLGPIDRAPAGGSQVGGESGVVLAGTDPLYPMILSVGIKLGADEAPVGDQGRSDAVKRFARIINVLFALASILLLAGITRRLIGPRAALVAAAILAVDPILLFFNALVLTETCYTTLLLAGFYAIIRMEGTGRKPAPQQTLSPRQATSPRRSLPPELAWAGVAGVCVGLGTLTRSSNLLMPLALAPFVWHFAGNRKATPPVRRLGILACFLLTSALLLCPTIIRNHRLFGHFVPVRTGSGASLLEALGPWADGGPGMDRIVYPPCPKTANEFERDRICRREALDWARSNPRATLRLAWQKLRRTWSIGLHAAGYTSPLYRAICWASVAPVFALALFGVWRLRHRPGIVALLLLPAAYFTLVHVVFVGSVRYRLPAMPLIFALAAAGLCLGLNAAPDSSRRGRTMARS